MLVSKAISQIRERVNDEYDTGFTDTVLIDYINDAIKYLSAALINRNDPILAKTVNVTSSSNSVPKNFVRTAGGFPVMRRGNKFYITDGSSMVTIKYFYMPDDVTAASQSLPFEDDAYCMIIVKLASIYAINQHEFNINQDEALRSQTEQLINQALGAVL
jgi:hypothetical protein